MLSIRRYPRLLVLGAAYAVALAAGCGGGDDGGGDAGDGWSPDAGAGAGGNAGEPANTPGAGTSSSEGGTDNETGGSDSGAGADSRGGGDATGGTDATNGGTSDGGGGTTAMGGETGDGGTGGPGTTTPAPEFEGVELEEISQEETPGCRGGFDPETGSISLDVEPTIASLLIDASGGSLRANGWVCTAADGTPAAIDDVRHLEINGTAGDDTVYLDLLEGPLGSELLENVDAIHVDLDAGDDRFLLRGTRDDDAVTCSGGGSGTTNALDLGGKVNAVTLVSVEAFTASLGPGNDSFRAGAGGVSCSMPLTIFGGDDADSIQGGSADDELNGGGGTDEFDMGSKADGSDVVNGGEGADLVSYGSRKLALTISLCSASDAIGCDNATCSCLEENGESDEGDVLVNLEDADGGDGPDTITGDDLPNVLSGRGGADIIQGLAGADQIYGDGGDDRIHGGTDDDLLIGGTGANSIDGEGGSGDICFVSPRDKTPQNCETKIEAQ